MHCREVANGNTLETGLQKPLLNSADLRKNAPATHLDLERSLGNLVGACFCMPPDVPHLPLRASSGADAIAQESTAQSPSMNCTSGEATAPASAYNGANGNQVESSGLSAEHCLSTLAAAACTVRKALEELRSDPDCVQKQLAGYTQLVQPEQIQSMLASPDFVPFRDAALWVSSWRHTAVDTVDFGGGRPEFQLGCVMPASSRAVIVTGAPKGDGLMCILQLHDAGLEKVQQSRLLDHIAPEACFVS